MFTHWKRRYGRGWGEKGRKGKKNQSGKRGTSSLLRGCVWVRETCCPLMHPPAPRSPQIIRLMSSSPQLSSKRHADVEVLRSSCSTIFSAGWPDGAVSRRRPQRAKNRTLPFSPFKLMQATWVVNCSTYTNESLLKNYGTKIFHINPIDRTME